MDSILGVVVIEEYNYADTFVLQGKKEQFAALFERQTFLISNPHYIELTKMFVWVFP